MFQNWKMGAKIGAGYLLVTLVLAVTVIVTLIQVGRTSQVVDELVNRSSPTFQTTLRVVVGVNKAQGDLRGWVLLGDEAFKTERAEAWSKEIEPTMKELKALLKDNPTQLAKIEAVEQTLIELKKYQKDVEDIAQTEKNIPANLLLATEAQPKADQMNDSISALIEEEGAMTGLEERKKLLFKLLDFRVSLNQSVIRLRAELVGTDQKLRRQFEKEWEKNQRAYEELEAQQALFKGKQPEEWRRLKKLRAEFEPLPAKLIAMREAKDWNHAQALMREKTVPLTSAVETALEKVLHELQPKVDADRAEVVRRMEVLTTVEWIMLALGLLISGTLGFLVTRSITRPLGQVVQAASAIATGDLTRPPLPETGDETGQLAAAFNKMIGFLRSLLGDTKRTTAETSTASSQIATAAQQQVTSLNETGTALNEVTTTAEEFKSTMQEFADRARAVQEAAEETTKRTHQGRDLSQDSADRINRVRKNSQEAGESVLRLTEQMQRIGEITASVNEIAEQTKLLALNASIEAARAGEGGRGFAVVATQVRELANQSKEAAGRIEHLISETQKSMQNVAAKIEAGSQLSTDSSEIVRQVAQAFEEIAKAIEQTTEAMKQINAGARQQEQGITELVSSITEIDSSSKESLTSAEQTQKAILNINEQIQSLNAAMEKFRT
jgi:methyl-accepting chemotaxis protein